jgi:putative thymidine phosphorylase
MLLKVKSLELLAGRPIAILHEETARKLGLHASERVRLKKQKKEIVATVDLAKGILGKQEIAVSHEVIDELKIKKGAFVDASPALKPLSVTYVLKKLSNKPLNFTEIYSIVSAIINNELTEAEVAYFVSAVYTQGLSFEEIVSLTKAMVRTGQQLNLKNKIVIDKHGIGGVAGNRTTPILTSIISAFIDKYKLDAVMPKTSSRAITSAAGTADVIETIAKVEFSISEIKKILTRTNACLVWGGSLGLAPADDKIIQVEKIINLDPEAQLIASILSKKLAVNATHVLLDITYGKSAKVKTLDDAVALKRKFEHVASKFNLNLRCILTKGEQPVGRGIGPVLEMMDVLSVLQQDENRPLDLEHKALALASELISFVTRMPLSKALSEAKILLKSQAAFNKFKQIIEAQHGSFKDIDQKLALGKFKTNITAHKSGTISDIDHKKIAYISRIAGCPADKAAGILLYTRVGHKVDKNQLLFTIYSETKDKLEYAKRLCKHVMPVTLS